MNVFKKHPTQLALATLIGLLIGIAGTYLTFESLMREGLIIRAQYDLSNSVKTAQALRDSDFAHALAIQESLLVDAIKKAAIVKQHNSTADHDEPLMLLETAAKSYIAKHPATLLRAEPQLIKP